ncbi:MAG: ShlB/FhaC/HecB family hemolysin secretion/activation protein [Cyanobacteria bacterium P01_G01_bin.67]
MLTPDILWRKSSFDDPQKVNRLIIALTAIATLTVLLSFEPLKAMEISLLKAETNKTNDYNFSARSRLTTESKHHTLDFNTKSEHSLQDTNLLAQAETPASEVESPQNLDNNSREVPEQIVVTNFEIVGSSVFSSQELNQAVKSYRNRPLTLPELFQARSAITKLYTEQGYVSSGAYIPPQELDDGSVKITVLEGKLEEINVSGTKRLSKNYISDRIEAAAGQPINVDNLLGALQLLRLDPLIDNVSAELSAGIRPGTSLLDIEIQEADVFNLTSSFNNNRSPSVGSGQRTVGLNHGNLFGFGDQFNFEYANTDGSNAFDFSYGLPINSKNGTIKVAYGLNSNDVIEEPFSPIDIESRSRYYDLTLRQPLILKPTQEFALGMSLTRTESETFLLDQSFPLSRGANEDGETKISAVRLFQEFVNRDDRQVLAFRSQFSFGVDVFNSTINDDGEPDSTFLSWRGQSQWVRRLDEDFLLLLRGDAQIAGGSLVPLEQFRLGGVNSTRGYRQDLSLGDNGLFASAELRIPVLRWQKIDGLIQIAPFIDVGTVWNSDDVEISNATLPSLGVGLNFSLGTNFNARLDWGIPLTSVEGDGDSLQEDGIYFSIDSNFF